MVNFGAVVKSFAQLCGSQQVFGQPSMRMRAHVSPAPTPHFLGGPIDDRLLYMEPTSYLDPQYKIVLADAKSLSCKRMLMLNQPYINMPK